jgi:hypothetical protein
VTIRRQSIATKTALTCVNITVFYAPGRWSGDDLELLVCSSCCSVVAGSQNSSDNEPFHMHPSRILKARKRTDFSPPNRLPVPEANIDQHNYLQASPDPESRLIFNPFAGLMSGNSIPRYESFCDWISLIRSGY